MEVKVTQRMIIRRLTLPYLLKSVFRSVALVVDDRPLTHRFLLVAAAALPAAACRLKTTSQH